MPAINSLPIAILQFAFTGVMAPHRRKPDDYAAPRTVSTAKRVFV